MEEDQECVKIVEICRVAPLPSPSAPKLLPLTFFDIILLPFPPTSRLYFYQNPIINIDNVLPNLKHSLSLILTHYLPLAGNLIWPQHSHKPLIQFLEGDVVSLTIAESNLDFHHLSGGNFRQDTKYFPLVPQLPVADDCVAVMALQLTLFPNKGFSIGITTHHAVVDGKTSTSFFKSWAHVCKNNLNLTELSSIPFYDRTTVVNSTAHLEPTRLNRSLNLTSFEPKPESFRCSLELTREDLQKLKNWILKQRELGNNNREPPNFYMSSFTLTLAYLLVCRAKLEGVQDGKMHCFYPVDARSRLHPPLPTNYFGNCLSTRCVSVSRNELLGEKGMLVAVEEISKGIQSLEQGVLKGFEENDSQNNKLEEGEEKYYVGGSPKFETYSANFGWGKPVKVEFITMDRRGFALNDSKNGNGGIEIGLVGEINELERIVAIFFQVLEGL